MLKSVLYSTLFGLVMEFQINVVLQGNLVGMVGVVILYGLIGAAVHYTVPFVIRLFKDKGKGFWTAIALHGLAGLLIIEWGFMGNTPWNVPLWLAPIAQAGMFSWWATIAVMPYVIQYPLMKIYKKKIFIYYGVYAFLSTILVISFGMAPVILLEPPVYLGFFYFYIKFAKQLKQETENII